MSEKINIVPIKAGNKRLITHKTKVAERMPTVFSETKPNKIIATDPLTPISVIAIVGIIEMINKLYDTPPTTIFVENNNFHVRNIKENEFEIKWGEQTSTDDAEGEIIYRTDHIPSFKDIKKKLSPEMVLV